MKINELKIGDRVKFIIPKSCKNIQRIKDTGVIKQIYKEHDNEGFIIDCKEIDIKIHKQYIISKLELNYEPNYKEIPIEKITFNNLHPETKTYCKECNKYMWATSGYPTIEWIICDKCKETKQDEDIFYKKGYNAAIDTAIKLVEENNFYPNIDSIICGLENSKIK